MKMPKVVVTRSPYHSVKPGATGVISSFKHPGTNHFHYRVQLKDGRNYAFYPNELAALR